MNFYLFKKLKNYIVKKYYLEFILQGPPYTRASIYARVYPLAYK